MCVIEDRESYLTVRHIVFVDILISYILSHTTV